jgi:hypothetical protein
MLDGVVLVSKDEVSNTAQRPEVDHPWRGVTLPVTGKEHPSPKPTIYGTQSATVARSYPSLAPNCSCKESSLPIEESILAGAR